MARARILLVEDDPSLRRFVAMALEDQEHVELVQCEAVRPALDALAQGSFALILTDLMMPGESGFDLLARLQVSPDLRGGARLAVLSAGLTPAVREQLAGLDVWRLLTKPVSVGALVGCVNDALQGADAASNESGPAAQEGDQAHAIQEYFEGNQALFDAYRDACIGQFPQDIREGDAACAAADMQALRRVAHSLKSVLLTLGYPTLSAQARALEDRAHAHASADALPLWAALRAALDRVVRQSSAT